MTIEPVAPPRELSRQEEAVVGVAFCSTCGVRLGVGDQFCRSDGTHSGNTEGPEADAAPTRVNGAVAPSARVVRQAPADHPRRSRALVTAEVVIVLISIAAAFVLTLGNSARTLLQTHTTTVVAFLGIVAVWAGAVVIALALCRAAAASDRHVIDAERTAAIRTDPELPRPLANLEWTKGQRRRRGITGAREPAAPSASTTPRATAPKPAHP